jgi:hypothetical protein
MSQHLPLSDRRPSLSTIHYPLFTLLLLALVGCGTGEYERRLNNRGERLRKEQERAQKESKFNDLYDWLKLTDVPAVSVRVPVLFKDPPLVEGAQVNGKVVDVRRVKPVQFDLPWLKLTYEGFVDGADGKTPYYCYVAAAEMPADQLQTFQGTVSAALNAKPHDSLVDWADYQADTPDGKQIAWKKLRFVGPQEFVTLDAGGQEQFKNLPGVLEVYVHEEAGICVLIAWRAPSSIEQQIDLPKLASAVAGCVSVKK